MRRSVRHDAGRDGGHAPRRTPPRSVGVDVSGALNLVGWLIKYLAPAFLVPTAIAIGYGEPVWPFLVAGVITLAAGFACERLTTGRERIGAREGYLVVALIWLLIAVFGAIPYLLAEPQLVAAGRRAVRVDVGLLDDGLERADRHRGPVALDGDVAAVHGLDRRRRDHRAVPGRAAAAAHRRPPGALPQRGGGPRDRARRHDPRQRPPLRRALRGDHRARDARARDARLDGRRPAHGSVPRRRPVVRHGRHGRLLDRGPLDRALRSRHAVGDHVLHGRRGHELRADVRGDRPPHRAAVRPRRRVPRRTS